MRNHHLGYAHSHDDRAMKVYCVPVGDGDGVTERPLSRLRNFLASMEIIVGKYPTPNTKVLDGKCASGITVHESLFLIKKRYPRIIIYFSYDAVLGSINSGGWTTFLNYWNARSFYPKDFTDRIMDDNNLTAYRQCYFDQDQNSIIASITLKQGKTLVHLTHCVGATFQVQLLEESIKHLIRLRKRFCSPMTNSYKYSLILRNNEYQIAAIHI